MIYGYRIENGKAVIVEEEAAKLRRFIRNYLSGNSVKSAAEAAGITLSATAVRHMLSNPVYLGDRYYPAILTKRTYNRVQREIASRSHNATRGAAPPVPVCTEFRWNESLLSETPLSAESVYRAIDPGDVSGGHF